LKTKKLGQRQIDVYAGLNVMILLLELHRYGQERDELKDQMVFYPCGKPNAEGQLNDGWLLHLIGYSCCVEDDGFVLIVGGFLRGANLMGEYLSRANLSYADLSHANLSRADLSDAKLRGANLRGANLSRAYLCDANLCRANLSGADLNDAALMGAGLGDTNLSGANLSHADLRGANLSRANLSDADLNDADLSYANLIDDTFGVVKWNENTKWENVRGLDTAFNVPEALRRQLGMQ
jgi:hypothetical protein